MIFLTVGSHEPFDRLIAAMDQWCVRNPGLEVFGQITDRSAYRPQHFAFVGQLDAASYRQKCLEARCLVSHAGMGSIITALDLSKPIVILPRRGHLQETRNDHQYATAREFRDKPGIFLAEDESHLDAAMARALSPEGKGGANAPFAQDRLIRFLADMARG